jgi:DHA1 family multidrug resistance protein-like MFS transporter
MIGGTIILAVCSFLNATAVEFWQFLLYRLLEGVGAAMWITSRQALLADILKPEERGRVLSYFSSFMLIGSAAGPTVGGLVASTWSIRAPFYIYTVVSIISLVLTIIFIHDTKIVHSVHGSGGSSFSIAAVKKILSKTNFIMASVATFTMFFLTAGVRDMIIPLYAANVVHLDEASIGYILSFATVINMFMTIPIGYMIDSQGRKSVILKSLFVTSGACLVFSFTNSFWTMAAAAIILGIGTSGAQQAPQAMATDVTIDDPHGLSMGLYRVFGDMGFIVGPTILGFLADAFGLTVPFYFMAVLLFINGVLVLKVATETFALKKMKKSETPAPVG